MNARGQERRRVSALAGTTACLLLAGLLAGAALAQAQTAAKVARIGYLTPVANPGPERAFREAMAALGYVEGSNFQLEYRNAEGRYERLPALAQDLVRLDVDVIVANVTQASLAAKAATTKIPIVMAAVGDPVGAGIVASLAKPAGNVTGNSGATTDVIGKLLELLRELRPSLSRVAILRNPSNPVFQAQQLDAAKIAAARVSVELVIVEARQPEALESAFRTIAASSVEALLILGDPVFAAHAPRIARFATEHRLPAVSGFPVYTDAGALASYGADFEAMYRHAAIYVDRILKGAKPADLPVEQPTRFELVVNLKTARALGIAIPPALVVRADRVIQ